MLLLNGLGFVRFFNVFLKDAYQGCIYLIKVIVTYYYNLK